jgi:hypothetical protein
MKKLCLVMGLCVVTYLGVPAVAQAEMGLHLGVEGAFVLPLGDWADGTGIGLGGMAKAGYEATDELQVTFRIGYIYHLSKDLGGVDVSTSELPIMVGAKYTASIGLFGELSVGMVNLGASTGDDSISEMKFGLMAGAGYSIASLSLGANLFLPDLGHADEAMGLLFTVGYDFLVL